jgi:hypothetical protein
MDYVIIGHAATPAPAPDGDRPGEAHSIEAIGVGFRLPIAQVANRGEAQALIDQLTRPVRRAA